MRREHRKYARHLYSRHNRKWRTLTAILQSLGCGELHRLIFGNMYRRAITAKHNGKCTDNTHDSRYADTCQRETLLTLFEQIPATHANSEYRTRHPTAKYRVEEFRDCHRIEHQRPEIDHLVAHRIGIKLHTHRMLHPAIGNENPYRRDRRTDTRHPCCYKVSTLAHLLPAEEHHSKERRLHKEGQDTLNGKRCAKDIAHKPRIITEIGTKLKLQDDTRSDTDREVNTEDLHPEFGGLLPKLIARSDIDGLHNCHYHSESQRQRNKEPMITGCHCKLQSRPIDQCGFYHSVIRFKMIINILSD